jgi:serine/threonine protein kinase/ABC-type branched-subunit amino acid transport system substrate-binding protein
MINRIGQQFGNYRLMSFLGSGGFADMYLGVHIRQGTTAAVKILRAEVTGNDRDSLLQDARTLASLQHPHIIGLLEYGVQGTTPYVAMDYAPGGTLRERHPRGTRLPCDVIVPYAMQVADALHYAHSRRVIHCDIKPDNILIGRNDTLLVSDFGLAGIDRQTPSAIVTPQAIAGTAQYMTPEQFNGTPYAASDQYALAVMVYEWLCGEPPFTGGNVIQLGYQHTHTPVPPLRQRVPGIPAEVEAVVLKALAKHRHDRYPSVQAFTQALRDACPVRKRQPSVLEMIAFGVSTMLTALLHFFTLDRRRIALLAPPLAAIYLLVALSGHLWPFSPTPTLPTIQPGPINYANVTPSSLVVGNRQITIGISHGDTIVFGQDSGEQCIVSTNTAIHTKSVLTIIAVATLSATANDNGPSLAIGNEELQGLCLEQQRFDSQHPDTPVWILIANIGTKEPGVLAQAVPVVSNQIITFASHNKNFLGVTGLSFSQSVGGQGGAMPALNSAQIPVVSGAASSSDYSDKWPYFYRVVPNDDTEGTDAALYAKNHLKATTAFVFLDKGNEYTGTLGQNFTDEFGRVNVTQEFYTVSAPKSFTKGINDMLKKYPPNPSSPVLIFCSCYASDYDAFRSQLQQSDAALPNAVFMGGEALYELGSYTTHYSDVYMMAFAYPDTPTILCPKGAPCNSDTEQQNFVTTYCQHFAAQGEACNSHYDTSRPGPHVMQSYDAMSALLRAYQNAHAKNTAATRQDVQQALSQLAFEGITGNIDFSNPSASSDPNNKVVLVLYVDSGHLTNFKCYYGQFLSDSTQESQIDPKNQC